MATRAIDTGNQFLCVIFVKGPPNFGGPFPFP